MSKYTYRYIFFKYLPACSSKNSSFNGTTIEFRGGLNMLFKVDIVRASKRLESRINPPKKD